MQVSLLNSFSLGKSGRGQTVRQTSLSFTNSISTRGSNERTEVHYLNLRRDVRGEPGVETALISVVVMVVVAAVLYVSLLSSYIADLQNATGPNYVGDNLTGIVGIIPVFYWLAVALATIGVAMVAFRRKK